MPQNLLRRTQLTFIWVGLIPVILAMLAWWGTLRLRERVRWVSHTQQVLNAIDDLSLAVTNAETGQRGFIMTGDDSYLEPYRAATPEIDRSIARLRQVIPDSGPAQQARCNALVEAVHARMDELQRTVGLRRSEGETAAVAAVRTGVGRRDMERIREISSAMDQQEQRLLRQRLREQLGTETLVAATFGAGVVVSVGLLFWAYHLIAVFAAERRRAEREALRLASELEQRVKDRTAELHAANENLQRSNTDLERFAYIASHDLQEPLRMISAYVDLLARRYQGRLDKDADEYIRYAVEGARRMRLLITDLLSYSRAGTQALRLARADMDAAFQAALQNLQILREETNAQIECGPLPAIRADEAKLVLVFQNLLSNAMKFHRPGCAPCIRVAASRVEDSWRFLVQDNGIGFAPEFSDRIFEVFQRLHPRESYAGTGIGLAISKRIVEAHGGHIGVESAEGEGSKFWFSLPAAGV